MKGATTAKISIHTPVKGVTARRCYFEKSHRYFNPHSREGSDGVESDNVYMPGLISIHTPVKGVTRQAKDDYQLQLISIHTPVKGVTQAAGRFESKKTIFQSTLP